MLYDVIHLPAGLSRDEAKQAAMEAACNGSLTEGLRIPIQISRLEQLGDLFTAWRVGECPNPEDIRRVLDAEGIWIGPRIVVRRHV